MTARSFRNHLLLGNGDGVARVRDFRTLRELISDLRREILIRCGLILALTVAAPLALLVGIVTLYYLGNISESPDLQFAAEIIKTEYFLGFFGVLVAIFVALLFSERTTLSFEIDKAGEIIIQRSREGDVYRVVGIGWMLSIVEFIQAVAFSFDLAVTLPVGGFAITELVFSFVFVFLNIILIVMMRKNLPSQTIRSALQLRRLTQEFERIGIYGRNFIEGLPTYVKGANVVMVQMLLCAMMLLASFALQRYNAGVIFQWDVAAANWYMAAYTASFSTQYSLFRSWSCMFWPKITINDSKVTRVRSSFGMFVPPVWVVHTLIASECLILLGVALTLSFSGDGWSWLGLVIFLIVLILGYGLDIVCFSPARRSLENRALLQAWMDRKVKLKLLQDYIVDAEKSVEI